MKWLLWKDYRHNRLVVIFGLFFLLLPYSFALYAVCSKGPQRDPFQTFAMAGFWSLITSQLTVALVAGNAIAGERADRSAEFLASLPISRRKLLASKLLFALAVTAGLWATTGLILGGLAGMAPAAVSHVLGMSTLEEFCSLAAVAVSGVAIFGAAWFLSSVTPSPAITVCGGLLAPAAVWCAINFVNFSILDHNVASGSLLGFWYAGICLVLGIDGFIAGTWYYLRRVEP